MIFRLKNRILSDLLLLRKLLLPVDDEGLLATHKRLEKLHSAVFVVDVKAPDVLFFGPIKRNRSDQHDNTYDFIFFPTSRTSKNYGVNDILNII